MEGGSVVHSFVTTTSASQVTHLHKLLSLTYKVLTTTQPSYVHNLISLNLVRSTRSSSLVALARPTTSSSLHITDHSIRCASPKSPCLWNQPSASLRRPHPSLSVSESPLPTSVTSCSSVHSPLSSSIAPSLFHFRLTTYQSKIYVTEL